MLTRAAAASGHPAAAPRPGWRSNRNCVSRRLFQRIILICALLLQLARSAAAGESFVEEAVVSPLLDGLVLVHTHFTLQAPHSRHHTLFPKAVGQLAAAIPFDALELSLTQGRWHHHRWGEPLLQAKPAGAELRAAFSALLPPTELPSQWGNLSHALGGLLCASLNFVARPEATAPQAITMHHTISSSSSSGWAPGSARQHVLYAALPQEASCTENLTPWLKLLPCRDAAGIGRFLSQRHVVFGADYHSMQVLLRVDRDDKLQPVSATLSLSYDMVLRVPPDSGSNSNGRKPPKPGTLSDIDLAALLGTEAPSACPVASASRLYVKLPPLQEQQEDWALQLPAHTAGAAPGSSSAARWDTPAFSLQPAPDAAAVLSPGQPLLYVYDLARRAAAPQPQAPAAAPFTLSWQQHDGAAVDAALPLQGWPAGQPSVDAGPVFAVSRYITGTGNLHGGMVLQLQAVHGFSSSSESSSGGRNISVCIFQVVPWYIRLWLHTLELSVDGQLVSLDDALLLSHISPAEDRKRPLVLDLCLAVPVTASSIILTAQFTKAFLMMLEHPPDAHRGFDVPSAIITVGGIAAAPGGGAAGARPDAPSSSSGGWRVVVADGAAGSKQLQETTPLLRKLMQPRPRQVYSPGLVVPLAVPDFSMPYNVICLTSTVLAVFVGGVLNALLWRPSKEERDGADEAKAAQRRRKKAVRLVVLTVVFGGLAVYFDADLQAELLKQAQALGLLAPSEA